MILKSNNNLNVLKYFNYRLHSIYNKPNKIINIKSNINIRNVITLLKYLKKKIHILQNIYTKSVINFIKKTCIKTQSKTTNKLILWQLYCDKKNKYISYKEFNKIIKKYLYCTDEKYKFNKMFYWKNLNIK